MNIIKQEKIETRQSTMNHLANLILQRMEGYKWGLENYRRISHVYFQSRSTAEEQDNPGKLTSQPRGDCWSIRANYTATLDTKFRGELGSIKELAII
jgi:hypothetical protein